MMHSECMKREFMPYVNSKGPDQSACTHSAVPSSVGGHRGLLYLQQIGNGGMLVSHLFLYFHSLFPSTSISLFSSTVLSIFSLSLEDNIKRPTNVEVPLSKNSKHSIPTYGIRAIFLHCVSDVIFVV